MNIATCASGLPGSVLGEGARPITLAGVKYMVLRADENVFYIRQVLCVACTWMTQKCLSTVEGHVTAYAAGCPFEAGRQALSVA
jgi:hypothetical protein